MSFLELKSVTKYYGDVRAVSGMSLSIEKGEFVSLLGPSGCGKTTTLQMIAGFESVSAGSILLNGADITHAKPNTRGLGIVFQTYALFPHMTVAANVSFGLEMRGCKAAERKEKVRRALELVHLERYGDRYPRELSGGQRQRVALARALVIEPPVLLLDEPLSNLDAKLREEMQFELREIQRKVGTTTIMVTHDQSEAMSVSDRVVVMEAGHITQIDTPHQVYEYPQNRFISTFVGKANLLDGEVLAYSDDVARVAVGPVQVSVLARDAGLAEGRYVQLGIRPEKLVCVAAGQGRCDATVVERFFQGSQWMYRMSSELGEMLVMVVNDGSDALTPGTKLGLSWNDSNVRLVSTARKDMEEGTP